MLSTLLSDLITVIGDLTTWKECREYEGEFESPQDSTIIPPAALIEIEGDLNEDETITDEGINVRILVVARRMKGIESSAGALDLVDILKEGLHDLYLENCSLDIHYNGFSRLGNLPGLKIYETRFKCRK